MDCGGYQTTISIPPGSNQHQVQTYAALAAIPLVEKLAGNIDLPAEVQAALRTISRWVQEQEVSYDQG